MIGQTILAVALTAYDNAQQNPKLNPNLIQNQKSKLNHWSY